MNMVILEHLNFENYLFKLLYRYSSKMISFQLVGYNCATY